MRVEVGGKVSRVVFFMLLDVILSFEVCFHPGNLFIHSTCSHMFINLFVFELFDYISVIIFS